MIEGVHSGGAGSILLYKGGIGVVHYMGAESNKLCYIEGAPQCSPTMGNPDNNENVGKVGIS